MALLSSKGRALLTFGLGVAAVAVATACKKEEDRPPVTNDHVGPGVGSSTSPEGGTSLGDGGSGVLATFGSAVRHMSIDSANVYVTLAPVLDGDAGGDAGAVGSIVAVPRTGAAPIVIESGGAPDDILVVGNELIWTDTSGAPGQAEIFRASLSQAGAATPFAVGLEGPISLGSDGTNVYFASNLVGASGVTVDKAGVAGGAPSNVTTIPGEVTAGAIVSDGTHVYVAANGLAGGEVASVPAGGGPVDVVWSSPSVHAVDLAFAAGTLYIAAGAKGTDGGLIAVHTTAPATTSALGSGSFVPTAMGIDGTYAYMTVVASGNGALARFPLAGGDPVSLADGLGSPVDLVVSDAAYVGTQSSLVRVAK